MERCNAQPSFYRSLKSTSISETIQNSTNQTKCWPHRPLTDLTGKERKTKQAGLKVFTVFPLRLFSTTVSVFLGKKRLYKRDDKSVTSSPYDTPVDSPHVENGFEEGEVKVNNRRVSRHGSDISNHIEKLKNNVRLNGDLLNGNARPHELQRLQRRKVSLNNAPFLKFYYLIQNYNIFLRCSIFEQKAIDCIFLIKT